jgi:uncharacterized protein YutE (UPF0331/DUF86 family)
MISTRVENNLTASKRYLRTSTERSELNRCLVVSDESTIDICQKMSSKVLMNCLLKVKLISRDTSSGLKLDEAKSDSSNIG